MSDAQLLYLVICTLYVAECLHFTDPSATVYIRLYGTRWLASRSRLVPYSSWHWLLGNPLLTHVSLVQSEVSPIAISQIGICSSQASSQSRQASESQNAFLYENIISVEAVGQAILVNGKPLSKCSSHYRAKELAHLVDSLRRLCPSERSDVILAWIASSLDDEEARRRFDSVCYTTYPLSVVSTALLINVFALIPFFVHLYGILLCGIPGLIALVQLLLLSAILFAFAHHRLLPDYPAERLADTVRVLLYIPAALRATNLLSSHALSRYSPVVVAQVVNTNQTPTIISEHLRRLKYPVEYHTNCSTSRQIASWYTSMCYRLSIGYLYRQQPHIVKAVLAPPERCTDAVCYCPRCASQFSRHVVHCPDCGAVELVPFTDPSSTEA